MDAEMLPVGHDDATVQTSNCQIQPKEASHRNVAESGIRIQAFKQHFISILSELQDKKCNLCHPVDLDSDIFDEYYFCDKCLSQL
eukprot:scaffold13605_cov145-Skeletonema_menzelii.AAC.4